MIPKYVVTKSETIHGSVLGDVFERIEEFKRKKIEEFKDRHRRFWLDTDDYAKFG